MQGAGEETARQTSTAHALSESEGKGGEPRKQRAPAPKLPPERLLNCVSAPLALRRGGWNPREPPSQSAPPFLRAPANGGACSWGVHETGSPSPPHALACVWARLAAGSRLGRTCSPVVRPGLLWLGRPGLCVRFLLRACGAAPGQGSPRRRAQPPGPASERARRLERRRLRGAEEERRRGTRCRSS